MRRKGVDPGSMIFGIGIGAGLMYLLDPVYGTRRRALIRDKAVRVAHTVEGAAETVARDSYNRFHGMTSVVSQSFHREPVDDDVLIARVRSAMGRQISHQRSIHVEARKGRVILSGPVLASEERGVLQVVRKVHGVKEVDSHLTVHHDTSGIPGLQGGEERRSSSEYAKRNWSPLARFLAGTAGSAFAGIGLSRRGLPGWSAAVAGGVLVARAATNLDLKRMFGVGAGRRAVEIQKAVVVHADPELIFPLWSNYKAFPFLMSHIRRVDDLGNGRSRWIVEGPAGIPIEFTARLTKWIPNRELAWETEEDSAVQHEGVVRFDPVDGGTRVQVRLFYNPPAGAVGHALVALMGSDPERRIEEDLARMKTSIETEHLPPDAGTRPTPETRIH